MKQVIVKVNGITKKQIHLLANSLKEGSLAVLPTDTIYGIHGSALNQKTIEKIYRIRSRSRNKPMIIAISKISDLKLFNIKITKKLRIFLKTIWPGPVSVILLCNDSRFKYLHRGSNSLAFRLPNHKILKDIIKLSGPLVSTSVNPEGQPPAQDLIQALKYFGGEINIYLNQGQIKSHPSTVIRIINDRIQIIRNGNTKIPKRI